MDAKIVGKKLVITMDLINPPRLSKSERTLLVATSGGNKETDIKIKGKNVKIGCNAYISR